MYQGINYNNTDWEIDEVASVRVMLQYLTGKWWYTYISRLSMNERLER